MCWSAVIKFAFAFDYELLFLCSLSSSNCLWVLNSGVSSLAAWMQLSGFLKQINDINCRFACERFCRLWNSRCTEAMQTWFSGSTQVPAATWYLHCVWTKVAVRRLYIDCSNLLSLFIFSCVLLGVVFAHRAGSGVVCVTCSSFIKQPGLRPGPGLGLYPICSLDVRGF